MQEAISLQMQPPCMKELKQGRIPVGQLQGPPEDGYQGAGDAWDWGVKFTKTQ